MVLNTSQLKDINKLHEEFRNSFSHFTPQSWSIEKGGLPRIVGAGLDPVSLTPA